MGKANTQSIEVKRIKNMSNSLSGATPPPLGHPPIAMVLYYPYYGAIAMRPVPLGGLVAQEGGDQTPENGSLLTKKYEVVPALGGDY